MRKNNNKRPVHKVYMIVELLVSGEVEDDEASGDYSERDMTLDDVLDLSGDFTRDLDADIEVSVDRMLTTSSGVLDWEVSASVLGLTKNKFSRKLY